MSMPELKKLVTVFIPLSWYKALSAEAAERKCGMTDLLREWIKPEITKLLRKWK